MNKLFFNRSLIFNGLTLAGLLALVYALMPLQTQSWPVPQAFLPNSLAVAATLAWLALLALKIWQQQKKSQQEKHRAQHLLQGQGSPWLVAYASQTGYAEHYAQQTAEALQQAGKPVHLKTLAEVTAELLKNSEHALFIVSTTGDGDAPDNSLAFVRQFMNGHTPLAHMKTGVLALGDSSYAHFCAFGRRLSLWLQQQQAQPLFDTIEVDNNEASTLRHWQHQLGQITGNTQMADWQAPHYAEWILQHRECLNPDSQGDPVFRLDLLPPPNHGAWQAGDIAEVGPCQTAETVHHFLENTLHHAHALVQSEGRQQTLQQALARYQLPSDTATIATLKKQSPQQLIDSLTLLPHREYSIASTPAEGRLTLLLRQVRGPNGQVGLGSAWLTENAPLQTPIALRTRSNRNFHLPAPGTPLILIGNGTGIAALRSLLKAREEQNEKRNWLVFGERNGQHDFFFQRDIERWQQNGTLERLDLAFSRDQEARIYVQDKLRAATPKLQFWVAEGAAIYVCGGLVGMAPAVHQVLQDALGEERLQQLQESGHYRRDVY